MTAEVAETSAPAAGVGRAALVVGAVSIAFATSSPFARLASPAHPILIAFGRLAIAAVILGALDLAGLRRALAALDRKARLTLVLSGAILAGHFALFQWGLTETSLPAAVSLVSLEPLSVVVAAWAIFGLVPKRLEQIGVLLATAGAVVVGRGAGQGEHRTLGDLLVIGSVSLYGLYVACARGLRDAIPARHAAPLVYATAAIVVALAFPFVSSTPDASLHALPAKSWIFIALIGLVPTVIGHTMVQAAARWLSPSVIALASPGETVGSMLLAAAIFGATPSLAEGAGAVVILAGAGAALYAQRPRQVA